MRVLLVDDHPILRMGVRQLIEREWPGAEVCEAETLGDAVRAAGLQAFDAIVLDLALPDTSGVEGVARMLRLSPPAPILVLSQNDESAYAARLLQMGVRGFLPKDHAAGELVIALRRVLAGGTFVTPDTAQQLIGLMAPGSVGPKAPSLPHEGLSTREFRVMQLIAAGKTPAQIATLLHLSVKTVASYRARIFAKTGWQHNVELTKYCIAHRLTEAE